MSDGLQKIQLGFVGLSEEGWSADALAPPLFAPPLSSKYTLVAVSTTNSQSAQASAAKYSQIRNLSEHTKNLVVKPYHGSAEHIALDMDVGMVAVAIKPIYQKDAAMEVIKAGKDLFIEWPVGKNLDETKQIFDAARDKGIKTIVGCQMRFAGFALKVKSMMSTGEIGKIHSSNFVSFLRFSVTISFNRGWGATVLDLYKHRTSAKNSATLLDSAGGHVFDLLLHILGPITSLSAVVVNHIPTVTVIDSITGMPTGETVVQEGPTQICVTGILQTSTTNVNHGGVQTIQTPFIVHLQSGVKEADFTWVISGENGTVRVQADAKLGFFDPCPPMYWNGNKVEGLPKVEQRITSAWEAFADGKIGTYANVGDALRTKSVLDAVMRSAEEGKRIDLL
ncbi:hypothetical protein EV359DRAFT_50176 [Lentinula novae-zelandiae]|nr:hypothetical protein EV359DRAFT_50176 [Lentinula novae-zelandiae]